MGRLEALAKLYSSFGPRIAFYRLLHSIGNRIPGRSFNKQLNKIIEEYLWGEVISSPTISSDFSSVQPIGENSPIWMLWWQGIGNAPDIVQACIRSVKQHADSHPVITLDQNNWKRYINLDHAQLHAFQTSRFTLAHLSDIFRVELLKKYGGIWMDSTLFMTGPFDKRLASSPLWTTHIQHVPASIHWSDSWSKLWSGYFIAAGPQNPLFIFVSEALRQYWRNNDCLIDYLLLDRLISLAYQHYPIIKQELDNIPVNNEGVLTMQPALGHAADEWKSDPDTWVYKLSWKGKYPSTVEGRKTLYSKVAA